MVAIPIPSVPSLLGKGGGEKSVNFEQAMVPSALFATGFEYSVFSGAINPTIKEMYSIVLLDITKGFGKDSIITIEDLDPHAVGGDVPKNKAEHFFSVPPKVIEVTEPYASKIVPTQHSGKYVESHGSIIRAIRIQGNSGLRPNKPLPASVNILGNLPLGPLAGPVNSLAGPIINRADRLVDTATGLASSVLDAFGLGGPAARNLNKEERTGYDDVMKLRNIFRAYSDIKKDNKLASKTVMLWRNVKDADYWVVEPQEFKLVQDSKSPMTYNYHITLKTLSRFEYFPTFTEDPLAAIKASNNLISNIQGATRELTNTLLVVSTQIDRLAGAGVFAQNLIMNPLIETVRGTSSVVGSAQGFTPTFVNNWQRLNNNLQEALDTLDSQLNTNVSTIGPDVQPVSAALSQEEQELADSFAPVINALRVAQRASRRVLTLPGVRASIQSQVNNKKQRQVQAYKKAILGGGRLGATPSTAGDKSFIGNDQLGGSVAKAIIGSTENIFSLAQRLLGNRNRWKLLVLVNDLKPPYITPSGIPQTLAPGQYILYPVNDGSGVAIENINANDLEKDQKGENVDTAVERAYGRDIRLKSDANNRTDVVIAAGGDIASIQGIPNVKQAMRLKFSTEQGTLTVHPRYGSAFPIGSKMTPISFNLFRLNAYATMISDARVSAVRRMQFIARGDILSIGAELVLKDTTDVTTTAFKVRSF